MTATARHHCDTLAAGIGEREIAVERCDRVEFANRVSHLGRLDPHTKNDPETVIRPSLLEAQCVVGIHPGGALEKLARDYGDRLTNGCCVTRPQSPEEVLYRTIYTRDARLYSERIRAMADFTPMQGRYLAYIHAYTEGFGLPPAESEIAAAISVSPPSVNPMMKTLENKALIRRQPGVPRSIEILIARDAIPRWKGKRIRRTMKVWTRVKPQRNQVVNANSGPCPGRLGAIQTHRTKVDRVQNPIFALSGCNFLPCE